MRIPLPRIIQGGMGAGISDWRLAQAVSSAGQLGVVSGTALDVILSRRLQDGDPGGHIRRALESFPFPDMARRILDRYFIPGGKDRRTPYLRSDMHTVEANHEARALCIAGNFVEVALAREGHDYPVGINFLEKIQIPHLPSLYGAMLAGVAVIIVGAGIPVEIPGIIDAFSRHEPAEYPVRVDGAKGASSLRVLFDPADYRENGTLPPLDQPDFLPIVSSATLAKTLIRRSNGPVSGFIVEHHCAGGHNAPPRGTAALNERGEPAYGPRDEPDTEAIRKLGLPFWMAGGYASPDGIRRADQQGAAGVQIGTAFALCAESGMEENARRAFLRRALGDGVSVFTDGRASPTGFPFKVAALDGTLSGDPIYHQRRRICDLGFLRTPYMQPDGSIGYRCAAEAENAFLAKGGDPRETQGRKCLCNALMANIGMPQQLRDGRAEPCLFTLGNDLSGIRQFCTEHNPEYHASDVIRIILGA